MTEGPCASLAFCRGLDLELLVEDLWGAGRGPGSALQGPPGLRLAGPEGHCGPRRSHARRGQSTARAGRAGAVATSLGTEGQRVGRFGVASAQCHGARVVRCDPPHCDPRPVHTAGAETGASGRRGCDLEVSRERHVAGAERGRPGCRRSSPDASASQPPPAAGTEVTGALSSWRPFT